MRKENKRNASTINSIETILKQDEKKSTKKEKSPFDKALDKYKKLIKLIEEYENQLKQVEIEKIEQDALFTNHIYPELNALAIAKYNFLIIVDKIFEKEKFTKSEQKIICDFVDSYAEDVSSNYEPLAELLNKYFEISISLMSKKEKAILKNIANKESEGAIDLDFENGAKNIFEDMFDQFNEWKHKTIKEKRVIEKKEIDPQKLTVNELYKSLAKILHPDLEQDEIRRKAKVQLMQELGEAKVKNDIYTMLQIQQRASVFITEEQQKSFFTFDKIVKFNKVLQERKDTLWENIREISFHKRFEEKPDFSENGIKREIKSIKNTIKAVNNDSILIKGKYQLLLFADDFITEGYF